MTAWQLPEIPAEAAGFAITRTTDPVAWHGQDYENVGAPGASSSVRKVLATAHQLKTVAQLNRSGFAPYAVVDVVGDEGNPIEGLTFSIPTHQAFLWWASQMPLKPIEGSWEEDVVPTSPEDPCVTLLLTPDTARLLGALLGQSLLFSDGLITDSWRTVVLQVMDAMRRLLGYAEHDRDHRPEPHEDTTSPLAFLLRHLHEQQ